MGKDNCLKVIIYGAGNYCREVIGNVPKEWDILVIADKDERLWGKKIKGYKVIDPLNIKSYKYDVVIILSYLYGRQIMRELQEIGIPVWRIIQGGKYLNAWDRTVYFEDLTKKYIRLCSCKTRFENRKTASRKLLYILIGYKDFLWGDTIQRVREFCPCDIDVCLLSSGLYDVRLSEIAKINGWSYFSTDINNTLYAQNLMLAEFTEKDLIFKMDEDVYVTKNVFGKMSAFFEKMKDLGELKVGFVSPMVPLNSSSYIFLEEFDLKEKYKKEFSRNLYYGGDIASPDIRVDSRFPMFYWSIDNIDLLNNRAESHGMERYRLISGRHAICFILFSREFYNSMGGFELDGINGNGCDWKDGDEFQIMQHCINFGYYGVMLLNSVCGHFCYSKQEKEMMEFRNKNQRYFEIRK
ncbi:hypothetical protein SAMN02910276_00819 [Butyrivibrio sp. Su6]|uniref:nucleoside-diphosphate sugar epimerase/dehydratase n=1 Tax=Butyrivibrio sp. Su6 TaxID=1520810 RepID=UPI00089F44CD|nr:hypothetical protein [Butyrivibrio sp. Su6]SEF67716.1 hypothetical protein SAMN02910276_00819 [Butyrivibrio sp. Su6]